MMAVAQEIEYSSLPLFLRLHPEVADIQKKSDTGLYLCWPSMARLFVGAIADVVHVLHVRTV
jgi:hypothetical protein